MSFFHFPMHLPSLNNCWAKTDPDTLVPVLSVHDHCLIVGTVAEVLLELLPPAVRRHFPESGLILIAGHDIGKITAGFLCKAPAWRLQWLPGGHGLDATTDHAYAGACYFYHLPGLRHAARWAKAIGGHHGRYLKRGKLIEPEDAHFSKLRDELLKKLIARFGPLPADFKPSDTVLHWFTGMMILADWIGSDETYFPPARIPDDLTGTASRAVAEIGLARTAIHAGLSFADLFRRQGHPEFSPNPLQQALLEIVTGPGLYIVEGEMGSGKTEAALAACHQLWKTGEESGLYFALPTRLTSERIHHRLKDFLLNICAGGSSLGLVHGTAWLNEERVLKVLPALRDEAREIEAESFSWFASSKRALLAPYGAGTIDQALTATLGVKHSALRLFALGGKTVVFDEVHSYDDYTFDLLCQLVGRLRELGGSVFILSATLTHTRRRQLLAAAGGTEADSPDAYSLITALPTAAGIARHRPVEIHSTKTVHLETAPPDRLDLWEKIAAAAAAGACVLVIRNTVRLAQETRNQLLSARRDDTASVALLHSRFTQRDRAALEDHWIGRLGKDAADRPSGCVLVATQIAEQSLDIDADFLVTDLAPTDLLLQRIGRLHRHSRPRPRGFEQPSALILCPEIDLSRDVRELLGPSSWVYPPYVLLRSAEIWRSRPTLNLPGEIRCVLEKTYRERDEAVPAMDALKRELRDQAKKMSDTANGRSHPLDPNAIDDPEGARTRWSRQKSATLILLKKAPLEAADRTTLHFPDGEEIAFPTHEFSLPLAKALHHRSVQLPFHLVKPWVESAPPWLTRHVQGTVALGILDFTGEILPAGASLSSNATLHYHPETGLRYERTTPLTDFDEEDGWW